jgi:hypothetical protein
MTLRSIERMRRELLRAARSGKTVTYGKLMNSHRLSRGRALSRAIGDVDRLEYASGGPGFAAIIVRKDTGYPGGGFFCDDDLPPSLRRPRKRGSDPRLSAEETNYIKKERRKIWDYYGRPNAHKS